MEFGDQALPITRVHANGYPDFTEKAGVNAAEFHVLLVPCHRFDSASTPLEFDGFSNLTMELDNISVTPVPESSSLVSFGLLLALGGAGMAVAARRKKVV